MRILFFSHYFPPEVNAPASRTYDNTRRWVDAGHEVIVITCAPNCPDGVVYKSFKNKLYQHESMDGIDVRRVWTYIAANQGTVRRVLNYLSYMISAVTFSFFVKRPDVIIATSPQFFCGWAGVVSGFFRRVPLILEIRDIWPESIVAVGAMRNSRLVRVLEWLEMRLYSSARHIVTVGDGYKRRLLEKGVPDEKISVVMNGVDRELFTPRSPSEELKREYGIESAFVCSYTGTIGMACGLEIVLEAAQKMKDRGIADIVFMLVGDGASRKDIEAQARERQLDNVIFTGRQTKDKMPDFLAISDVCFVHLRKTDLFTTVMPSKIFEAAGMAKPIINGVGGYAADFIERAGAGINIEPENSDQFIEALMLLRNNTSLGESYGNAGREHVIANFDSDRLARDYLEIINTLVYDN